MNQAIFATFDSALIGAHLGLSNGNLQLQTLATSDNLRMARSNIAASRPSNVEFLIYSPDGTKPSLASQAMTIGICTGAASFANYVGGDTNGLGYSPYDGNLYSNGAVVAYFGKATYGDYITLVLDTTNSELRILRNGQPFGDAYSLPGNTKYYFAATVSGTPSGMALLGNCGATPFADQVTGLSGWWAPRLTPNPRYVSTDPYITLPGDTLAHQKFSGDIDRTQSSPAITRCMDFWGWGASKPPGLSKGSQITLDVLDPDKIYDEYTTVDVRDLPWVAERLPQGTSYDSAEPVYAAVIDRVDPTSDQTKRFVLKDKIVQTQAQLVRPVFPPTADPAVAGKTRPSGIGIIFNQEPSLYDSATFKFACTDTAISAFGDMRIQGIPQVYGGSYAITEDGEGIQLVTNGTPTAPAGKVLVTYTTFGGTFDPSGSDFFRGLGLFESMSIAGQPTLPTAICYPTWEPNTTYETYSYVFNGLNTYWCTQSGVSASSGGPTGTGANIVDGTCVWICVHVNQDGTNWQPTTAYTASQIRYNGPNTYKCLVSGTSASSGGPTGTATSGIVDGTAQWGFVGIWSTGHAATGVNFTLVGTAPNKAMRGINIATASEWLFTNHPDYFITPGRSYAFAIKVKTAPYYGDASTSSGLPTKVLPAQIFINCHLTYSNSLARIQLDKNATEGSAVQTEHTYTGAFTFNTIARGNPAMPVYVGFLCNPIIQNPSSIDLLIEEIIFQLLPDVGEQDNLPGPGLDYMLRSVLLGTRGPFADSDYDPTGAQAIDAATGAQYGLLVGAGSSDSVEQCCKSLTDSVGGDIIVNRSGKIGTVRLIAPEDVTDIVGTLTETDFNGYLLQYEDFAENLSSRISGAKNESPCGDSDFTGVTESQCPSSERWLLKQDFQWTVTGGFQLAPRYATANTAKPLPSRFAHEADGQAEANRITKIYSVPRNFYVGEVNTPIGRTLEIGQVWFVEYPSGSLVAGENLLVVGLTEKPSEETSIVYLWGL
jgi:hypothetical protein